MVGIFLMTIAASAIHRLAVDQDLELLQRIGTVLEKLVIQRGIARVRLLSSSKSR